MNKYYINETRKAQEIILMNLKFAVRQPLQIKSPLVIKSLFAKSPKLQKKRTKNSLPICTLQESSIPTQIICDYTERIHSQCPTQRRIRQKNQPSRIIKTTESPRINTVTISRTASQPKLYTPKQPKIDRICSSAIQPKYSVYSAWKVVDDIEQVNDSFIS